MARFLVSAQAVDRPGIVSAVSGAVAGRQWSVEDATMSRLAGRFAMLLVVNTGDESDFEDLRGVLQSELPSDVHYVVEPVEPVEPVSPAAGTGSSWTITVYGSDRPGIVSTVAKTLADRDVNIDDLSTRVSTTATGQVYTMLIDATVPESVDGDAFAQELRAVGELLGVTCHASPVDTDIL